MSRKLSCLITILLMVACVCSYLVGASLHSEIEPEPKVLTVTEIEYVPKVEYVYVTVEEEVQVIKEIPTELRQFQSEDELREWLEEQKQATTWLDFGDLICVDYASAFVELARGDGFDINFQVMSIHPKSGRVIRSHALCNTIIGDKVYFIEPQTYEYWSVANIGEP